MQPPQIIIANMTAPHEHFLHHERFGINRCPQNVQTALQRSKVAFRSLSAFDIAHPLTRMRVGEASSFIPRRCVVGMRIAVIVVLLITLGTAPVVESTSASLATDWYGTTRCPSASSSTTPCGHYERCKVTHRCARGEEGIQAMALAGVTACTILTLRLLHRLLDPVSVTFELHSTVWRR